MFWRERSCIESSKEQNHYEPSRRWPKQIRYEKKKWKKKNEKKNEKKKMKNEKWKKKKKKTLKESKCHVFVKQVVFLTVNHRGPLPLRELHSTDERLASRDPGGFWACLRPVYHYGWNHPISVKKSQVEEKKEKAVFLSSKRSKTTKKNSWVDKDLANKQKT